MLDTIEYFQVIKIASDGYYENHLVFRTYSEAKNYCASNDYEFYDHLGRRYTLQIVW